MTADIAIVDAHSHAVDKEVFRRNALDFDLAFDGCAGNAQFIACHARLDFHAHLINHSLGKDFFFAVNDFNFWIIFNERKLLRRQITVFVNLNVWHFVIVDLCHANLLDQRIMEHIGQDTKAIVPFENKLGILGCLVCTHDRLRRVRDKLYGLVRLQEHPHQGWLDCADCIADLCSNNL